MKNIVSRFKRTSQRVIPACCCMILALLLVACAGGTTSTPTPAPTPQPSATPSPTPTPGLTVYTGKGYAISYPQAWKVTSSKDAVTFSSASGDQTLVITVNPNPDGVINANTFVNASIAATKKQMENPQTETLPPTTTVGGESWVQKSMSGTETSTGQSVDIQLVVMSDNHPTNSAHTQNFSIVYVAEKSSFATANTSYFQPMLHSFKFT